MNPRRASLIVAGAALCVVLSFATTRARGGIFIGDLRQKAFAARDVAGGKGVTLAFRDRYGWLTRHPILSGGKGLDAATRTRVAAAVAAVSGIGGVSWANEGDARASSLHCQDDVERILETRTIRFGEASTRLDPSSDKLLGEVARALHPCVGSIIAVTGHTDAGGNAKVNVALSQARAEAVRSALISRGIPGDGLRASGVGAARPVDGLDPRDPANRRIEFSVLFSAPVKPTPIDTPGPE
ncbi:OmpA family protein [Novosphingobium sp. P6W]|uniref:OmpA family protein n=1 Tax=Novosphingobium sp. P6W TaxID=1609758 RepID=UPI0005C2F5B8|nr:OmpA family protein [Novosphingobium sp. P6W]AXB75737.1 OmpA family protein [Novosphingobium sp. P6W]KIS33047.1 membrane protein [Novosphingobium sp. P6W]